MSQPVCPGPHLDGSVECRPPPAQHQQAQDGDAVAEVVDEGHVVDECVCISHKHDDRRSPTLGEDLGLTAGLTPRGQAGPIHSPLPMHAAHHSQGPIFAITQNVLHY